MSKLSIFITNLLANLLIVSCLTVTTVASASSNVQQAPTATGQNPTAPTTTTPPTTPNNSPASTGITSTNSTTASTTSSSSTVAQPLEFSEAWARQSVSGNNNSAVYFTITNSTDYEYIITGVSAANVANKVQLHETSVNEKGVSQMVNINKIVIPAHSAFELKPGGVHIMLFNLKKPLNSGDQFPLIVTIQDNTPAKAKTSATLTVTVE